MRGGGPVPCTGPPPAPPEVRGQGGRGSEALCQIRPQLLLSGQYFIAARLLPLQRCEGKGAEGGRFCVKYAPSCSCQVCIMYHPPPSLAEMRGQGGRGSTALCQIRPQLLLSGQYYVERTAYSLCRDERARGQREHGSVSNTPPAALVRSVLCSAHRLFSAEV